MKPEIEDILRADCSDHICKMASSLAQGEFDRFDLYYDFYQLTSGLLKTRGVVKDFQMDIVVNHLYELRNKKWMMKQRRDEGI